MFQYFLPDTCASNSTSAPMAFTGPLFDLPPCQTTCTASPCCASAVSSGFVFAPVVSAHDLYTYTMSNAAPSLDVHDAQAIAAMLASPLDRGSGWGYLDELDHTAWMRDSASPTASFALSSSSSTVAQASVAAPSTRPAAPCRPRSRCRPVTTPAECERRRAHRRSLQKGYERDYRLRKRETREALRTEWLSLEYKLKSELLAAQSRAVQRGDTDRKIAEELRVECEALRVENKLLTYKLVTETRLREAREYFRQPRMREKLNAVETTPCVMKIEFTW